MRSVVSFLLAVAFVAIPQSAAIAQAETEGRTGSERPADPPPPVPVTPSRSEGTERAEPRQQEQGAEAAAAAPTVNNVSSSPPVSATAQPPESVASSPSAQGWLRPAAAGGFILLLLLMLGLHWQRGKAIQQLTEQVDKLGQRQKSMIRDFENMNLSLREIEEGALETRKRIDRQTSQMIPPRRETSTQAGQSGFAPPPPANPVNRGTERIQAMEVALSDLLASPVVKASEYEAKLREFGQLWSVAVAPDGSRADLVPTSASPGGRLIGVQVAEGLIAIVPSGRFVKDFSMTFKESLEAGADVKTMFDCRVDGSAALKIKRIAYARVVDEGRLTGLHKGELMGFVA